MEPRPSPPPPDGAPFLPGDIVGVAPQIPRHQSWLAQAGEGVVVWCKMGRRGGNMPCRDWVCGVQCETDNHFRQMKSVHRSSYLASGLRLLRRPSSGWLWPQPEGIRPDDV